MLGCCVAQYGRGNHLLVLACRCTAAGTTVQRACPVGMEQPLEGEHGAERGAGGAAADLAGAAALPWRHTCLGSLHPLPRPCRPDQLHVLQAWHGECCEWHGQLPPLRQRHLHCCNRRHRVHAVCRRQLCQRDGCVASDGRSAALLTQMLSELRQAGSVASTLPARGCLPSCRPDRVHPLSGGHCDQQDGQGAVPPLPQGSHSL